MQEHMDLIFDAMDGMEDSDELAHLTIDLPELASWAQLVLHYNALNSEEDKYFS